MSSHHSNKRAVEVLLQFPALREETFSVTAIKTRHRELKKNFFS